MLARAATAQRVPGHQLQLAHDVYHDSTGCLYSRWLCSEWPHRESVTRASTYQLGNFLTPLGYREGLTREVGFNGSAVANGAAPSARHAGVTQEQQQAQVAALHRNTPQATFMGNNLFPGVHTTPAAGPTQPDPLSQVAKLVRLHLRPLSEWQKLVTLRIVSLELDSLGLILKTAKLLNTASPQNSLTGAVVFLSSGPLCHLGQR